MAVHSVGFFGLKLVPGDVQRMDVTRDFRLTNVSFADDVKAGTKVIVKVHYAMQPEFDSDDEEDEEEQPIEEPEEQSYTICFLVAGKNDQATIDLQFVEEEEVGFSIVGNAPVDLIGNYIAPPDFYDQDPDSESEDDDEIYSDIDMEEMDGDDEDEEDNERFQEIVDTPQKKEKKVIESAPTSANKKRAVEEEAAASPATKLTKNQEKRANKKVKTDDETPSASPAKSDKATPAKKEKVVEEKKAPAADKMTKTKLPSGLVIEEKKTGSGPIAKPGQRVGMRYVGKLQNGKVFDQCVKGKPFVFKLGKGEVIKAWDEGVKGMQVGTERRLTCPPKLAYGNQKIPGIPPNSTLIFDVKLVEIK